VTIDHAPGVTSSSPAPTRRHPRWLAWATVTWAVIIAMAAIWGAWHGRPTVREQSTIGAALPVADAAIGRVAAAAAGPDAVAALGGYSQTSADCRVTPVRSGQRYERWIDLYTAQGNEGPVLDRIAARLPASYHATVRHVPPPGNALEADAGTFVAVHGVILGPGVVRVTADTGCRPVSHPVSEPDAASTVPDRAPVQGVLDRLGATSPDWRTHRVPCPSGGSLWTVEATARGAASLTGLASSPVISRPDLVAYRTGPAQLTVSENSGVLVVTSTTGC
jgi:hypothetical protein